jgi:hypothetical protein
MGNAVQDAPKAPRGWLWLARCTTGYIALLSLLAALAMLIAFLENVSGNWHEPANIIGLAVCLIVFLCAVFPYGRVMWSLRRESPRAKGLSEAVIIGAFWFFFELIFLSDSSFHGLSAVATAGVAENSAELLGMAGGIGLLLGVPAFLLIAGGMKLAGSSSQSGQSSEMPDAGDSLRRVRVSVGAALALVLLPAVICPFTLRPSLSILQFVIIEVLMLAQAAPYVLVLRGLSNPARKFQMAKTASAVAAGFLTLLLLAGALYAIIVANTPSSRPHQMSTWAELVFFALLVLANIAVLMACRGDALQTEKAERKKSFDWTALAVPLCLLIFGFFVISAFAST